jgi:hypothetical protein
MFAYLIIIFGFLLPIFYMYNLNLPTTIQKAVEFPKATCFSKSVFVRNPTYIDSYEEKSTTVKTSKVVVPRGGDGLQLQNVTVWFPTAIDKLETEDKKTEPVTTLFVEVSEPPKIHNNIVMRLNVYANNGDKGYTSLLTRPIIIDSQCKARENNTFSAFVDPNCCVKSGTVLVIQREYFHIGEYDFPNLVTVKLD